MWCASTLCGGVTAQVMSVALLKMSRLEGSQEGQSIKCGVTVRICDCASSPRASMLRYITPI